MAGAPATNEAAVYAEQFVTIASSIADNQDGVFALQMTTVASSIASNQDAVFNFQMITVVDLPVAVAGSSRRKQLFIPG